MKLNYYMYNEKYVIAHFTKILAETSFRTVRNNNLDIAMPIHLIMLTKVVAAIP